MSVERLSAALADRYTVERELGAGGMARVYLAEDLKHHRHVAIKVLRPELAAVLGAERFVHEIDTTAQLQHPHILPLFDSGNAGGQPYYVMPYVEGETLRDKLNRETQLGIAEAVRITREVADALDYAHRHGVVHRDIKPENILLHDGRPMVADFGIALAVSAAAGGRMTETGLSLGTPHYMSPEQATADKEITGRSDIYSLASVLYEMLSGNPPHTGSSAQQIIMKIVTEEAPPVTALRKNVPPNVSDAVAVALQKLPADRFATAQEFAQALSNHAYTGAIAGAALTGARTGMAGNWPRALWLAGALVVVTLGLASGFMIGRSTAVTPPFAQHRIELGSGPEQLSEAIAFRAAVHPAGLGILYPDTVTVSGKITGVIKWKARGDADGTVMVGLEGAYAPTFSPDGEWIAFVQEGDLKKRQLAGGSSITLARGVSGGTAFALAWLDDGTIVHENAGFVLQRIAADGTGASDTVSTEARTAQPIHMTAIPGTRSLLVSACVLSCALETTLSLLDLDADTAVTLADDVVRAWPAPGGRIIYLTGTGAVLSASLDLGTRRLGPGSPVLDGVRVSGDANGEMQVGRDGTALLVRGTYGIGLSSPVQVSRSGSVATRMQLAPQEYTGVALSPDGGRVALTTLNEGAERLWVTEIGGGPLVPLTPPGTVATRPVWIEGGRRVAYISLDGRRHVRAISSDGASRVVDTLFAINTAGAPGHAPTEVQFTAGGDTLVIRDQGFRGGGSRIVVVTPGGEPKVVLDTESDEFGIALSPDRRWLAYVSDVSGRDEIYVRPFPAVTTGQVAISLQGGSEPQWAHDGEELFYRGPDGWLVAAQLRGGADLQVIGRSRLFDASGFSRHAGWRGYQVMPGDERFLMLVPAPGGAEEVGELFLVEHLFARIADGRD